MNFVLCDDEALAASLLEAMRSGNWPRDGKLSTLAIGEGAQFKESWCNTLIDGSQAPTAADHRPDDHWINICRRSPEMLNRVAVILTELMRPKLGAKYSKLSGVPYCGPDTLSVEIRDDGFPKVRPGSKLTSTGFDVPPIYADFSDLFVAAGERFLIHFFGVLAAREHLRIDGPLVLHRAYGRLDGFHRRSLVDQLHRLHEQVIVLEDYCTFDSIKTLCKSQDVVITLDSMA